MFLLGIYLGTVLVSVCVLAYILGAVLLVIGHLSESISIYISGVLLVILGTFGGMYYDTVMVSVFGMEKVGIVSVDSGLSSQIIEITMLEEDKDLILEDNYNIYDLEVKYFNTYSGNAYVPKDEVVKFIAYEEPNHTIVESEEFEKGLIIEEVND